MLCLKIISNSYGSNADGVALSNLKLLSSTKKTVGYAKLSIRIQGIPLMHGAESFTITKTCED